MDNNINKKKFRDARNSNQISKKKKERHNTPEKKLYARLDEHVRIIERMFEDDSEQNDNER